MHDESPIWCPELSPNGMRKPLYIYVYLFIKNIYFLLNNFAGLENILQNLVEEINEKGVSKWYPDIHNV